MSGADGLPIVFEGPLAIVGGGVVDPALLVELDRRGVALVGADGGGDAIGDAGLVPAAIIGDLDSLSSRTGWEQRTRVIHLAEQETTDFEKALYSTAAPLTLALGMTGKRLDHTLSALNAMQKFAPRRHLLLVDEVDVALAVIGPFSFEAAKGERVSIYPLAEVSFTHSERLLYPLDGLTLAPGGRLGTSNEGLGGRVEIVPADDTPWLLILDKSHLPALIDLLLAAA